jgi:hypothetical protein
MYQGMAVKIYAVALLVDKSNRMLESRIEIARVVVYRLPGIPLQNARSFMKPLLRNEDIEVAHATDPFIPIVEWDECRTLEDEGLYSSIMKAYEGVL